MIRRGKNMIIQFQKDLGLIHLDLEIFSVEDNHIEILKQDQDKIFE